MSEVIGAYPPLTPRRSSDPRCYAGLSIRAKALDLDLLTALPRGGIRADALSASLTPATLVAVRGRPTLASAVSREKSVTFAGDQLNEPGTARRRLSELARTMVRRLNYVCRVAR